MAFQQSTESVGRLAPYRLGDQTTVRHLPSHPSPAGRPDFIFAFHDGAEIGPAMLARIAKHTGLTPEDL